MSYLDYYDEIKEPVKLCRWCNKEVKRDLLCSEEHIPEVFSFDYREDEHETKLIGVCPKCFDQAITLENVLAFSKEYEDDAVDSDERYRTSVIAWLYPMDELLELAKKDMKARLESGIGIDEERVKKAMHEYVHADEDAFVEFMDKEKRQ